MILASDGTGVGFPSPQPSTLLTCAIISTPSLNEWADSNVVLQCACSAAADITPQKPGDPDSPNVRWKSMTTDYPTELQKTWASSGST